MKPFFLIVFLLLGASTSKSSGQEINFGQFFPSSLTVSELNPAEDLDFGTIVASTGLTSISLANSKVITINGLRFLDVIVDITADNELLLDGNPACSGNPTCSIPYTLEAAYANLGQENISQARFFNVAGNVATAQFPILRRNSGPPGPPPTPFFQGFDPTPFLETAFIYIFGSINVGAVSAGDYSSTITITVIFD